MTTDAGGSPGETLSTVDPVPCPVNAWGLVTDPAVRTTSAGFTSSLDGAGTRLCQFGLSGHIGSPGSAAAEPGEAAAASAPNIAALTRITRPRRLAPWTRRIGLILCQPSFRMRSPSVRLPLAHRPGRGREAAF